MFREHNTYVCSQPASLTSCTWATARLNNLVWRWYISTSKRGTCLDFIRKHTPPISTFHFFFCSPLLISWPWGNIVPWGSPRAGRKFPSFKPAVRRLASTGSAVKRSMIRLIPKKGFNRDVEDALQAMKISWTLTCTFNTTSICWVSKENSRCHEEGTFVFKPN